jgi:hypothetical protein
MLEYVVIVGLIVAAGYWIVSPLLHASPAKHSSTPEANETLIELELRKEGTYSTIRELEFDLEMGKVSKEDYETLKEQYMLDAIDYVQEIETLQTKKEPGKAVTEEDIEAEIEREISALRSGSSRKTTSVFCSDCGTQASTRDRFCSSCGAKLVKR